MVTLTFRMDGLPLSILQGVNGTDFKKVYGPIFAASVFKRLGDLTSVKLDGFGVRLVTQNELARVTFVELGKRKKTRAYYCEALNFVWVEHAVGIYYVSIINHNKMWNLLNS